MKSAEITALLKSIDIFSGIPEEMLAMFSEQLKTVFINASIPVIEKGTQGDTMYVIVSGKVKVHDGEHVVATMEAGNFFGEFSLLDAAPRSMSVTTTADTELLTINREHFFNLLRNQPEVAKNMIGALTRRLRSQTEAIIRQLRIREEELSKLVDERTKELQLRTEQITIKNKEITDNVNYARRIQTSILPEIKNICESFRDAFVLYMPKDIVSGDFFSFFRNEEIVVVICADCTGHGVTGAFLSVVGNSLLRQIINERKIYNPAAILNHLHEEMIAVLNQRNNESTDGMDIAICVLHLKSNTLHYAGAHRPLWIIRKNEIIVFSADKFPVGGLQIAHENDFTAHEIQLMENDTFYIFSDGYADQFGGESGKKLMTKKFKELLLSIQHLRMTEQKAYLTEFLENWKGTHEQVDDVLVMGFRN